MASEHAETERTVVKTYVPAYQKDEWQRHAERLEMSQSEFVRTMVQAGRRGFLTTEREDETQDESQPVDGAGTSELADRVTETLSADSYRSWDELVAALTDDIEDRLEATLEDLQDDNEIRYSGRNGGYTLTDR